MHKITQKLIEAYYDAFNTQNMAALLDILAPDVAHDINKGYREVGREAFARYLDRLNTCYREHIYDIEIMTNEDGSRAATEYTVLGIYLVTDRDRPPATGQTYRLPGGSFFEIEDGKIARVSVTYNTQDWLAQVSFQDSLPPSADQSKLSA